MNIQDWFPLGWTGWISLLSKGLSSETESRSVVSYSLRPHGHSPWNSLGKSPGVDCPSLLQWIFPTQGLNLGLPHCRQILYHVSHREGTHLRTLSIQMKTESFINFSSVQSLSRVQLFVTPWIAARQASLSITNYWSLPKLVSTESVMPSNHLILCHPILLLHSIFPSIRVFSKESVLRIR